ncbi:MAG: hypothetical protein HQK77_14210 [Desulfobacterales bacterium]|nr:hypothetical protein [Desulfobacterales bacterium]
MKKLIVVCFALCLLVGCSQELPEGYKLMCSTTGNKFTVWLPHENRISCNIFDSKNEAIRYAISWDKFRLNPIDEDNSKNYKWSDCSLGGKP